MGDSLVDLHFFITKKMICELSMGDSLVGLHFFITKKKKFKLSVEDTGSLVGLHWPTLFHTVRWNGQWWITVHQDWNTKQNRLVNTKHCK